MGKVSKTVWTKKKTYSLGKSTGWNFSEVLNKELKTGMWSLATYSSRSAKLFLEVWSMTEVNISNKKMCAKC